MSRRNFIATSSAAIALAWHGARAETAAPSPMIDIHMHRNLPRTRTGEQMATHQKNIGATLTVILPLVDTHDDNDLIIEFTRQDPTRWVCFACAAVQLEDAPKKLGQALDHGAIGIGELKSKVACDSLPMQEVAAVARDHGAPVLIHFEDKVCNDGYARFHRMLEKFPETKFIGHGPSFWAYLGQERKPEDTGTPKGPVTPGGLTDRWLADYPNFYGDLAAGSGNNALMRDPAFAADFVRRQQHKLMYGSDCPCATGMGPTCISQTKNAAIKALGLDDQVRRKILYTNARDLLKLKLT